MQNKVEKTVFPLDVGSCAGAITKLLIRANNSR